MPEPNRKPPRADVVLATLAARYRPGQVVTLAQIIDAAGISERTAGRVRRWALIDLARDDAVIVVQDGHSLLPAGDALDGCGQVVVAGLDVPPCRLQALVAGQGGDHLQPHAGVGQVLAPGVPQHVRR